MLYHKGTGEIKTQRLLLRRFTVDDDEAMFENWAKDERVTRFLGYAPHSSSEETRQVLAVWCADYENESYYDWAVEFEGEVIGSVTVVNMNNKNECAELGYTLGYDYWNRGITTEAVSAVRDFLFEEVGVHRIEITHAVKNPASGRVARKCGFKYEGIKRESYRNYKGKFYDVAVYGIVRKDWKKLKKAEKTAESEIAPDNLTT